MTDHIALQVAAVHAEIAAACHAAGRDPTTIRLIAVTKSQGPEVLAPLAAAGIVDLGENRWDHQAVMAAAAVPPQRFHAIGRIQSRQLAKLVPMTAVLHSLHDPDHVPRLEGVCAGAGRTLDVFVQVNVSGEAAKAGLTPEAVGPMLDRVRSCAHLHLCGLMTMAPEGAAPDVLHACFGGLADLGRRHGVTRLSMGMSQDFPIAIAHGATDLRIGTRLFTPP
jgi:pyridoxal phosphate enzyme (YggS family)